MSNRFALQDGDPYRDEMEQCVGLIMDRLQARGLSNHYSLAYQSRVGPVRAIPCQFPSPCAMLGLALLGSA